MQDKVYNIEVNGVKEAQKDMGDLNKTIEKTEKDFKTLSQAISDGTEQLAAMKIQGQEGTKAYEDLAISLGNMKDAMDDASAAVNAYANDTKNLTDVIDVFETGTSVVGLYQSALVALGADGDKVEQTMKKLLAVETALNSIQKIQSSLMNKSSGTYKVAALAIKAYQWAMQGATIATKGFRAALVTTGIGAILVAIGVAINSIAENWDKVTDAIGRVSKNIPFLKSLFPTDKQIDSINKTSDAFNRLTELQIKNAISAGDYNKALELIKEKLKEINKQISLASEEGYRPTDRINELKKELEAAQKVLNTANDNVKKAKKHLVKSKWRSYKLSDIFGYTKEELKEFELAQAEANKNVQRIQDELKYEQGLTYEELLANKYEYERQLKDIEDRISKTSEESLKKAQERTKKQRELEEKASKDYIKNEETRIKYEEAIGVDRLKIIDKLQKLEKDKLKLGLQTQEEYNLNFQNLVNERIEINKKSLDRSMDIYREAMLSEKQLAAERLDSSSIVYEYLSKASVLYFEKENNILDKYSDEISSRIQNYGIEYIKLQKQYDEDINNSSNTAKDKLNIQKKYSAESLILKEKLNRDLYILERDRDQMIRELEEERKENIITITNELFNTVSGITDSIFERIDADIQRSIDSIEKSINSIDSMLDKVDRNINRHINRLTGYYEALSDTTGEEKQDMLAYIKDQEDALNHQYDLEKQLEAEKYQRENQLRKEQARRQKKQLQNQLIQAIITGAANTLNGFNTQPFWPVGLAMGTLAATLSAVQIGVIGANIGRIKYANGGLLSGPSHNDGGIPVGNTGVEVEGGEYVVNKKATAKYLPLLEQINDYGSSIKKFANGGEMNLTTGTDQTAALLSNINFNPVVAVTDINRANSRLDKVKVLSR